MLVLKRRFNAREFIIREHSVHIRKNFGIQQHVAREIQKYLRIILNFTENG